VHRGISGAKVQATSRNGRHHLALIGFLERLDRWVFV
jgi:hypothetical protein